MASYKKSPDELKKASEALFYEIRMLKKCVKEYKPELRNFMIESFCVHLRNLIVFFEPKSNDHITYQYFLPSGKSVKFKHKLKEKYGKKVNNLLSHLTFKRLEYGFEEKKWPMVEIANEVNENIRMFLEVADTDLICDELKKIKTARGSKLHYQLNSKVIPPL